MSQESVQLAIGKAILDKEFCQLLFADPDQALAGWELTVAEENLLKRIDLESLELMAYILSHSLSGLHLVRAGVLGKMPLEIEKNKHSW